MYNDADVGKCLPALLVHCKEEKKMLCNYNNLFPESS